MLICYIKPMLRKSLGRSKQKRITMCITILEENYLALRYHIHDIEQTQGLKITFSRAINSIITQFIHGNAAMFETDFRHRRRTIPNHLIKSPRLKMEPATPKHTKTVFVPAGTNREEYSEKMREARAEGRPFIGGARPTLAMLPKDPEVERLELIALEDAYAKQINDELQELALNQAEKQSVGVNGMGKEDQGFSPERPLTNYKPTNIMDAMTTAERLEAEGYLAEDNETALNALIETVKERLK